MASQPTVLQEFCEKRKVIFRCEGSDQKRELRILIERETNSLPMAQKVLNILISDDEDPYFMCGSHISEEDYKILRDNQNLLVDFEHFHEHIVRLFSLCTGTDDCRFMLLLTRDGEKTGWPDQLQVMEATNFKNLCHISLPILCGSDADIKRSMAMKIRKLQDENRALARELSVAESKILHAAQRLEHEVDSRKEFENKCMEEKAVLRSEFEQKLLEVKDTHNKELLMTKKDIKLEKQCLEDKYEDFIRNMESQTSSLKAQVKTAMEKNLQAENDKRELRKELTNAQEALSSLHRELSNLKQQNTELDTDYHQRERMIQNMRTRLAVMEKELKDKSEMLETQQEINNSLLEQKNKVEEILKEKESSCHRLKISLRTVSDDFVKANELLILHQKELMKVKKKMKLSAAIAFEQERILKSKTQHISEMMELMDSNTKKIKKLEEVENDLRVALKELEENARAKEKRIKINESVIERLNRLLKESQSEWQAPPNPCIPRYAHQRPLLRSSSTPSHGPGGVAVSFPSTLGAIPKVMGSKIGVQMPIKTTGPPQLAFSQISKPHMRAAQHKSSNGLQVEVCASEILQEERTIDKNGVNPEVPTSVEAEANGTSAIAVPREEPKRSSYEPKAINNAGGGILRNPNPPFSAYFISKRKE